MNGLGDIQGTARGASERPMTKATQIWDKNKKQAFFRAHIGRATSIPADDADKLAKALAQAVNMMRVWDQPPEPPPAEPTVEPTAEPVSAVKNKRSAAAEASPASDAPFDPFAFSVMVVLAKFGKDALAKRLADITSADDLRALAEAQHLAVNANLKKPEDLRKAIVAATAQRLADRKAAAS